MLIRTIVRKLTRLVKFNIIIFFKLVISANFKPKSPFLELIITIKITQNYIALGSWRQQETSLPHYFIPAYAFVLKLQYCHHFEYNFRLTDRNLYLIMCIFMACHIDICSLV